VILDLVEGGHIVVQEIDEHLVRVSSIFSYYEYVHPSASACLVFQAREKS